MDENEIDAQRCFDERRDEIAALRAANERMEKALRLIKNKSDDGTNNPKMITIWSMANDALAEPAAAAEAEKAEDRCPCGAIPPHRDPSGAACLSGGPDQEKPAPGGEGE